MTNPSDERIPLVRTGPGPGYYRDTHPEDLQCRWRGFEPILIGGSVVSFISGALIFGSLVAYLKA